MDLVLVPPAPETAPDLEHLSPTYVYGHMASKDAPTGFPSLRLVLFSSAVAKRSMMPPFGVLFACMSGTKNGTIFQKKAAIAYNCRCAEIEKTA